MPTLKQRKVAMTIIESVKNGKTPTGKEVLKSANYAESVVNTHSTKIINSEGVQEALEDYGFTEDNAKKVVAKILLSENTEPNARIRAAQEVFKVRGSYAPDKSVNLNLDISQDAEIKANEIINRYLDGVTGDITGE